MATAASSTVIYSQMGSLASTNNCNAGTLLSCLHCVVNYALLDEMTDFGYPHYVETRKLNDIKTNAYRMEVRQRPPMAVKFSPGGEKGYSTRRIEGQRRKQAEMKERRESQEKNGVLSAMVLNDLQYRRYYTEEIEEATDILASNRKK
ncbi:hypothetical protein HA466_0292460 [Hirschfeldia incana]|nr:hypothetical protein HA466_0292460 [Hirschfeldia incana]